MGFARLLVTAGRIARLSLAFVCIFVVLQLSAAAPTQTIEKWKDPCNRAVGGSSSTSILNLTELLQSLIDRAGQINTASREHKNYLTQGQNPRISTERADLLDSLNYPLTNFPHDYAADPEKNETVQMWDAYAFLSKVFIFHKQMTANNLACDDADDSHVLVSKIQSVLDKTLLTLCGVNTYLVATGHPMPAFKVPATMTDVVDQEYQSLGQCDKENTRYSIDFLIANYTITTTARLRQQFAAIDVDAN